MSDTIHAGDLAEYCGKVKLLAGRRVEVLGRAPARLIVAFSVESAILVRSVKESNLKRLGGGGNT